MGARKRTFVLGDIHGAYRALLQCFERSGFSPENDRLIFLGDVADRRGEVRQCMDELLKVKELVFVLGNHDVWMRDWFRNVQKQGRPGKAEGGTEVAGRADPEAAPAVWTLQGGDVTMASYRDGVPDSHAGLMERAVYWHSQEGRLFVHGGVRPDLPLEEQAPADFIWDRSLVKEAWENRDTHAGLTEFEEVFVGHTPTLNFDTESWSGQPNDRPLRICNVWLLDTGAGWSGGRLTIMDLDTGEYWQSDKLE